MANLVPIISSCVGLNTVVDPITISNGADNQLAAMLAQCMNVVISDNNKIELVKGFLTLENLTAGHSLFCDNGACLIHDGGSMYEVAIDLTLSVAKRTGMSGDNISHTQAGDAIYYSNLSENGIYYGGTNLTWSVDPYIGPETSRYFVSTVPLFSKIAYFNGYMLGAIGNALYASELGLLGLWEMKPIWMSNSDVIMIKPVEAGVFVSDRTMTFFLRGNEPRKFVEHKIANYPAIEWSVAHGLIDVLLFSESIGLAATWMSKTGRCLGFSDGSLQNVTQNKIKLPSCTSGASLIMEHNIISTMR